MVHRDDGGAWVGVRVAALLARFDEHGEEFGDEIVGAVAAGSFEGGPHCVVRQSTTRRHDLGASSEARSLMRQE